MPISKILAQVQVHVVYDVEIEQAWPILNCLFDIEAS